MWLHQSWHNLESGEIPCWSVSWYQPEFIEILVRQNELPDPNKPMLLYGRKLANAPAWLFDKIKQKSKYHPKVWSFSISPITAFLDD